MRWPLGLCVMVATGLYATTPNPDDDRACWRDQDCSKYPLCHKGSRSCRCQIKGICLLARRYSEPCLDEINCVLGLICSEEGFCVCEEGGVYLKHTTKCVQHVPNGGELPRFADLPDEEDPDGPPEIPATYGGPILVGCIGIGLVVLCLGAALWCRCTSPRSPVCQSPVSHCSPMDREKIPLDLFYLPPPEKYRTPGYCSNYHSIREVVASTSTASTSTIQHDAQH